MEVMKWIGVLFIGGLLADEMMTFSSLNVEQSGSVTSKMMEINPSWKVNSTRKGSGTRKVKGSGKSPIPRRIIVPQRSCECGIPNTSTRIVGGQDTLTQQYPWMAMLQYNGRFYCGGSLINPNYILTAAHCLRDFSTPSISITLLAHKLDGSTPGTFNKKISKSQIHPLYNPTTFDNDIGLLKLESSVKFDELLRPVCLPYSNGDNYAGQMGLVTGWGDTSENSHILPSVLREVYVPIISNQQCLSKGITITRNMICAGEEGRDSCQGDSGGPLHIKSTNKYQQIGIVSWGLGCARPDKPGVYTRVSNYIQWITMSTRDGSYC
ncbi:TMPRSS6.2 family protein [Megaselia abdita]